jgi:beta-glucosidase
MNRLLKVLLASSVVACLQSSAFADITGKAVDGSGNPLVNAFVTYTGLNNRFIWAYSDAQGNFTLPGGGATSVEQVRHVQTLSSGVNPQIRGGALWFSADGGNEVTVDIYSLRGSRIDRISYGVLHEGRYAVHPFTGKLARAVYVVKIRNGSEFCSLKMLYTGTAVAGKAPASVSAPQASSPLYLEKKEADVEVVRVGKTGYFPKLTAVQSFTQNLGNVAITKMDVAARVDSVFNSLTLPQKIYQTVMCDLGSVHPKDIVPSTQIGTYLGAGGVKPPDGNNPTKWANWLDSFHVAQMASATKVPLMIAYDAVHGLNVCVGGTVNPHNIALGATWDPELVKKAYRMEAVEVRGTGANWVFSPCIAVPRHLHWGRVYEGFGETPEIARQMAKAAVLGFQGWDLSHPLSIAACIKHFAADGGTDGGANNGNCTASDSILRLIHLPGYVRGVEAEAATVMPSFSSWRGTPMHFNKPLLTDYLKTQLGFDGFAVGDYYGDYWGTLKTVDAISAGLDVPMHVDNPTANETTTLGLYNTDATGQARVTDAVKRVLRTKIKMGLFDNPNVADPNVTALIGCQMHRDIARECVRKSLVLLKNANGVLPIAKTKKVHLVGDFADNMGLQCGGWTISWQGSAGAITTGTTVKQGFAKLTQGTVTSSVDATGIPNDADVVIVCVGEKPYAEGDGDNGSLSLSSNTVYGGKNYTQLITDCKAKGKPLVCLLFSGRPMIITNEIQQCDAFVACWLPGTEGDGIAEVLYGDYDFRGKLPHTWPLSYAQEPINTGNMGDYVGVGGNPLFAFDYGLNLAGQQLPSGFYSTIP